MNQQSNALVNIGAAAVIMLIISVVVYFVGAKFIGTSILSATGSNLNLNDWEESYFVLVQDMGLIAGAILVFWTMLTHWVFSTANATGIGKRWFWLLLLIILVAVCIKFPYFLAEHSNNTLKIDENIPLLFVICYALVGYWGGSILVTSDNFRYTPIFAIYLR